MDQLDEFVWQVHSLAEQRMIDAHNERVRQAKVDEYVELQLNNPTNNGTYIKFVPKDHAASPTLIEINEGSDDSTCAMCDKPIRYGYFTGWRHII